MKFTGYDYSVRVVVQISGSDLLFLKHLSSRHYDHTCRAAGAVGGFLYGFIQFWITASTDHSELESRTDLGRQEEFKIDAHELGVLGKICEFNPDPNPLLKSLDFVRLIQKLAAKTDSVNDR